MTQRVEKADGSAQDTLYEAAVVGAGPIGIEMAIALKRAGVPYIHLEAKQIGYTISWWPRDTHFFSTTERIELAGVPIQNRTQQRTTGEEYLAYLRALVEQFDLQINTYEPVVDIRREPGGFLLRTHPLPGERTYRARRVILAVGDMDVPNLLNIPGEDLPNVSHYFRDPHDYFRKRLLIVGGRNSAVEAALRCWRAGARVTLSYRRAEFGEMYIKDWLMPDLKTQIELGNIAFLPETRLLAIYPDRVTLERAATRAAATRAATDRAAADRAAAGEPFDYPTDFILINTGFSADPRLFELAGVRLLGDQRAPEHNPETMETNVPGVYVAGTAAAGTQTKFRLFIENAHVHVGRIVQAITGQWPDKLGTIAERRYEVPEENLLAD